MDLEPSPSERAFADEARRWLETNLPRFYAGGAPPSGDTADGFARCRAWERQLFEAGWSVVTWPREYGGREATIIEWLLFEEEYHRAGAPQRVSQNGISLLAPTLFEFGTDEQRARILRRMAAVDDVWAQGWSEPNAGSDLAALSSRAVRDDKKGGWRLSGQKTWCSRGAFCDWLFGLFRSDATAERHRGLTYFLVPLSADGVTVRPVQRLDGEPGFAEVFLDDVFVPDRDVLGEVHKGWDVAMATAGSERGLNLRSPGRFLAAAARLVELFRRRGGSELDRDAVARAWIDAQAYRLYTLQMVARLQDGVAIGPEASINKIFWSELDVRLHETALSILGPEGELGDGDESAWLKGFQFALAGPIYAGTNEIQRNVVAERVLGLPEALSVRFAFSDEQRLFQRTMRDLLARACPPAEVRAAWTSATGRSPARWAQLAEVGVVGLTVPAAHGGLGGDALDWVLPLEEAGRAALPEPLLETTAVAAPLLAEVAPASDWLARIADGRAIVATAIMPARAASPSGSRTLLIADAHVADLMLLRDGDAVHGVTRDRLQLEPRTSVDGARRLYAATWTPAADTLLAAAAAGALADAVNRGALAAAAELLGLGARMLEMTVEYVKVRRQFGQAVGSFQAVKHQLADALVGLELARPLVYHGAYALSRRQPDRAVAVAMAKSAASEAAQQSARAALQCHGAIGYSFEHDLHLFMKRAWALAAAWGDAPSQRARVAAHLLLVDGGNGP